MTAAELLASLRRAGAKLSLDGPSVRFRAPAGAIPDALRAEARERRAELVALLRAEAATPPPGARVYVCDVDARPCTPGVAAAFMWCWEGGPQWFYVRERPVPATGRRDE